MTANEILKEIKEKTGVEKKSADAVLASFFEIVKREVKAGNSQLIKDFGSFKPVVRKARSGRNPKTGEAIEISEKKSVKFVASKVFTGAL